MAEETVKQENIGVESEKTFTQEDVNRMIGERLARENAKYSDYEELKKKASEYDQMKDSEKSELQKATERADQLQLQLDKLTKDNAVRVIREKVAKEKGIPVGLLTGDTEELCISQADAIIDFAKPGSYPTVKDTGEMRKQGKKSTADQFADWLNDQFK